MILSMLRQVATSSYGMPRMTTQGGMPHVDTQGGAPHLSSTRFSYFPLVSLR